MSGLGASASPANGQAMVKAVDHSSSVIGICRIIEKWVSPGRVTRSAAAPLSHVDRRDFWSPIFVRYLHFRYANYLRRDFFQWLLWRERRGAAGSVLCCLGTASFVGSWLARREKNYSPRDLAKIGAIAAVVSAAGIALLASSGFHFKLFDVVIEGPVWAAVGIIVAMVATKKKHAL